MDWQTIMNNPKFVDQYGMYVTGDPETFWNNLPEEQKIFLNDQFGNPQANIADPILEYTSGLAAKPNNTNQGVLTGYEDYSPNDFLNEATGENAANRVSQEDYNVNMETGVLGTPYNTRSDAQYANMDPVALQQLADAGNPTAQAMLRANVRQPYQGPQGPVLVTNNMNAPAATVPNVDYADPTMAPTNALTMAMNEEAGRGNIYDGPVLIDTTQPNNETTTGVLGGTTGAAAGGPSVRSIMSSSGPKTSNRRGSMMPDMLIDRNEALIRIGGRMYGGALKGDGISAATDEYGKIQDANRKTAMEKYKADQAQKLAMAKAAAKGKKTSDKDGKMLNQVGDAMFNYQKALGAIRESRAEGGNLTGLGGMAKALVDNFTGDEDAARRLILQRVKVDDALLRVAETKGAISNAEMKLFLAPAPKNWQDEAIWEQWILDRMNALQNIQNRLTTGQQVPMGDRPTNAVMGGNTAEPDADGFSITIKETTQK